MNELDRTRARLVHGLEVAIYLLWALHIAVVSTAPFALERLVEPYRSLVAHAAVVDPSAAGAPLPWMWVTGAVATGLIVPILAWRRLRGPWLLRLAVLLLLGAVLSQVHLPWAFVAARWDGASSAHLWQLVPRWIGELALLATLGGLVGTALAAGLVRRLPAPLVAIGVLVAITVSTTVFAAVLYPLVGIKLVARHPVVRRALAHWLVVAAEAWIDVNSALLALTQRTTWDVRGLDNLPHDGRFLVVSNHVAWSDILVLQRTLNHRIPFLKFFLKQKLIWVPLLGPLWWALDFPFMKRHAKETLEKHPELRQEDLETTRRMCARFREQSVSILSFAEGTRFTAAKHDRQESPYTHLLRPKAGGIAFVLDAMPGMLDGLVDVTLVYSDPQPTLWRFLGGKMERLAVEVKVHRIPNDLEGGDYFGDAAYRSALQRWLAELWVDKDRHIAAMRKELTPRPSTT